jgi:hypothetical protein
MSQKPQNRVVLTTDMSRMGGGGWSKVEQQMLESATVQQFDEVTNTELWRNCSVTDQLM